MSQTDMICPHICGPVEILLYVTLTSLLNEASYTIMYMYYVYKNTESFSGNALRQQEINYGVLVADSLTR